MNRVIIKQELKSLLMKNGKMVYQYLNLSIYHLPIHLSICHLHIFQMFRKGKTLVSCKSGLNELGITGQFNVITRKCLESKKRCWELSVAYDITLERVTQLCSVINICIINSK